MRSASAAAGISCPQLAGTRGCPSRQWTLVSAPSVCLGFTRVNNSFILAELPIALSFPSLITPHTHIYTHAHTHTHPLPHTHTFSSILHHAGPFTRSGMMRGGVRHELIQWVKPLSWKKEKGKKRRWKAHPLCFLSPCLFFFLNTLAYTDGR